MASDRRLQPLARLAACCAPSKAPAGEPDTPQASETISSAPQTAALIAVDSSEFLMGSNRPGGFPADGEGPQRRVRCSAFSIAIYAVSNAEFGHFVAETGYVTDAQNCGWSFVFDQSLSKETRRRNVDVVAGGDRRFPESQ